MAWTRRFEGWRGVSALVAVVTILGCYDSRWGESKRAQRHNAAYVAPAAIETEGRTDAPVKAARVRAYVTPAYAAQVLDWPTKTRDLLDDVTRVLSPALGVRLALESATAWDPGVKEEDLRATLEALRAHDAGADVDWVVGFIGNLPQVSQSFHELGFGNELGKHLVVRAPNRLDEYDAVDRAFDQLSEDERLKLRRDLKRHRASAIFLHELGHTLGALHERDPHDLMHPRYDRTMNQFSAENLDLMGVTLARRGTPEEAGTMRQELLSVLDRHAPSSTWVAGESDMLRGLIGPPPQAASGGPARAPAPDAVPAPPAADLTSVASSDRPAFTHASEQLESGDPESAWKTGSPLFRAYPDSLAVQDLRCRIASQRNLKWEATRAECARLMTLSTQPTK